MCRKAFHDEERLSSSLLARRISSFCQRLQYLSSACFGSDNTSKSINLSRPFQCLPQTTEITQNNPFYSAVTGVFVALATFFFHFLIVIYKRIQKEIYNTIDKQLQEYYLYTPSQIEQIDKKLTNV